MCNLHFSLSREDVSRLEPDLHSRGLLPEVTNKLLVSAAFPLGRGQNIETWTEAAGLAQILSHVDYIY